MAKITKKELIRIRKELLNSNKKIKAITSEITLLEKDPKVKKYIELKCNLNNLQKKETEQDEKYQEAVIASCDHIMVMIGDNCDGLEGRHDFIYECVKCTLTNRWSSSLNDGFKYGRWMDRMWHMYGECTYGKVIRELGIIESHKAHVLYAEAIKANPKATVEEIKGQMILLNKEKQKIKEA